MSGTDLSKFPIHLGRGATAHILDEFTGGMDWYERYGQLHGHDGREGRLVSMHTFSSSWDSWEVHPHGAEVVVCIAGQMTLIQEMADGSTNTVTLAPGEYAVNAPGVWHTADIVDTATALFITAGEGTQHRAR